jgi:hypothetical protein
VWAVVINLGGPCMSTIKDVKALQASQNIMKLLFGESPEFRIGYLERIGNLGAEICRENEITTFQEFKQLDEMTQLGSESEIVFQELRRWLETSDV